MFYPASCPQYYPLAINEMQTDITIPVQCHNIYSIPLPVIVNTISPHIYPYPQIMTQTGPVTYPSIVSVANEFSLQPYESPIGTPASSELSPVYSEISTIPTSEYVQSNGPLCGIPVSNLSSYEALSNETNGVSNQVGFAYPPCSMLSHMQVPNEFIPIVTPVYDENCDFKLYACCELELPQHTDYGDTHKEQAEIIDNLENPLEYYFSLPENLFPAPRMMPIDPNYIIDEFCKVSNIDDNAWILDLEFGVPKTPVSRRVATYNVKLNSINCKNAPEAIHPGFESCDKDFKRALLFYYDCVISNWYRGYVAMTNDRSVENFQSWLRLPMQALGMYWRM